MSALEARYLPTIDPEWLNLTNVEAAEWNEYRTYFDPLAFLDSLSVRPDEVQGHAELLLMRANRLDQAGDWSRLINRAPMRAWKIPITHSGDVAEATGAPPSFVHIFFNDIPKGAAYSANGLDPEITGITGAIRSGRTLEVKQQLLKRIVASWTEITAQSPKHVVAGRNEIDSDTTMEHGLILPKPGDEEQWFKVNADALDGISGTGL